MKWMNIISFVYQKMPYKVANLFVNVLQEDAI